MLINDLPNADSRFLIKEPEIETRCLMNGSTHSERPIEKYLITIRRDNAGMPRKMIKQSKGEPCMYIEYKGQLYRLVERSMYLDGKPAIVTDFKEKADDTFLFLDNSDCYIKELKPNDADVKNIYEVDFYVMYHDTSETVKKRAADLKKYIEKGDHHIGDDELDAVFHHIWCANGGAPILDPPKIANNEVEIILSGNSCSEDWIMFERGWCYKAVNIYDCEKLLVRYTYSVRDGKKLAKKETVEVTMKPEEFKAEKLKYGLSNI